MNILKLTLIIVLIYASVSAYLFVTQRSLIYFPPPPNNHGYPEESFQFENVQINVITLNPGKTHALLYFGGNAEAVEYNAPTFPKHFPNHSLYLVQYRGYGNSTGKPTEANNYSDALAIFDRLNTRHAHISVMGRSLGSGVATLVASKRNIDKLVLITPYDSLKAIAQSIFPFFPMSILLQDKYNSLKHAKNIHSQTLLLLAENDEVIPTAHSMRLANALPASLTKTVLIHNTEHNTISNGDLYFKSIRQFLSPHPQ